MERLPTTGSILSLGHFPLTDCQSSVWINQQASRETRGSEVPRYDVQAACRVVPGFAEDDDQIQSILCIGIPRLSHM
ncbi:uncharacterized protein [Littorina saxatilis]|uniref:uncharacterized protein isoform X3 n=1 Tax=Littorina saxatilis TaxID=31220 RepID=UPI0038B50B70